jgi:hypothetical protein
MLGALSKKYQNFLNNFEVVICDEFDQIYDFMRIENKQTAKIDGLPQEIVDKRWCHEAYNAIGKAVTSMSNDTPLVVAMSATPEEIINDKRFSNYKNKVQLLNQITGYTCNNKKQYYNLEALINNLPTNTKYLCYVDKISVLLKYEQIAKAKGFRTCAIWSLSNEKYQMNEDQLRVRASIVNNERISNDIDFLFINNAYMTGINIRNEDFNNVIIHNTREKVEIQVLGRIRHDTENVYVFTPEVRDCLVPEEFLNIPLTTEDKERLVDELQIHNECGRLCKWTTVKNELLNNGYVVEEIRKRFNGHQTRCSIIKYS